ncbi:hypothetical protein [Clostridium tyrobutyricum]|uniref:hypothetical protein n=1 Tax=Clostridium tyrobutyricum TaxID=1519 RepID=UPI0030CE9233
MAILDEDKAVACIKGYLNVLDNPIWTKEYILANYGTAVELLVEKASKLNSLKTTGVKSMSEGGQSMTFSDNEAWSVTDDIKTLLPAPYARMMG